MFSSSTSAPRLLGIAHASIVVADMERSLGFYRDLLGLQVVADGVVKGAFLEAVTGFPGARARVVLLSAGDAIARVELVEFSCPRAAGRPPEPPHVGASHVALRTTDIHAHHRRLVAAGVRAISAPQHDDATWAVNVLDPDGVRVELLQDA